MSIYPLIYSSLTFPALVSLGAHRSICLHSKAASRGGLFTWNTSVKSDAIDAIRN
jgi:hypothetical protein